MSLLAPGEYSTPGIARNVADDRKRGLRMYVNLRLNELLPTSYYQLFLLQLNLAAVFNFETCVFFFL
jgi:hypothetical protein